MGAREAIALVQEDIAQAVLDALGGRSNVLSNTVCMTRLRVTLDSPESVDFEQLNGIPSVLGTATRGDNGLEVVFGPRTIDEVYHAFTDLTGIAPGSDALFPMSRQQSSMRIQINKSKREPAQVEPEPETTLMNDDEFSALDDLFGEAPEPPEPTSPSEVHDRKLLVINGPNINMLGLSKQDASLLIDYPSLLAFCKDVAAASGFERCDCFQSNHEGDLIDRVQDAYGLYDAIVVNPGLNVTPSAALCGAISSVSLPTMVVHLYDHRPRKDTPLGDLIKLDNVEAIEGIGIDGYRVAIEQLAEGLC